MQHEKNVAQTLRAKGEFDSIKVTERSVYRGPHLFSALPMIRIQIDLRSLEQWPSNRLPGFNDALLAALPSLSAHGCSYREPGGLVLRLRDGTWLGHVIEHVALELQTLAGSPVSRGKTRSVKGVEGRYNVLYHYRDEEVGLAAGLAAVRLVAALLPPEFGAPEGLDVIGRFDLPSPLDVNGATAFLRKLLADRSLGPTTRSLVEEAQRRGIPVMRLDEQSLVQLGHGKRQRRIRASITGNTSQIAVDLAGNKQLTKQLLGQAGLPVPRGAVVRSAEEAVLEARRLRFPVVIKPLDGNHGRGVTIDIRSEDQARAAFEAAAKHSRRIIVEKQLPGHDHRILVIGGKLVAVAERLPARVIGDGYHDIATLIEILNEDPRRGEGHERVLTRVKIDPALHDMLARQGKTLANVPAPGETVWLRGTANLSTGGTAVDRTDDIHPDNVRVAEQAAAAIGLDVAGIDFLIPDIARSVHEIGGGIVEVNAAPGFRMHLEPSEGQPRNVAGPVIDSLFPRGARSRIPIFAVTGSNGKSTTARMVARILCEDGRDVGLTTTSGVYYNGHLVYKADASGPKSARMVLRDPRVDVAVFETARGGIVREGLGFDRCDVGAVLNVTEDHLGLKGINTLEELTAVKSVVVESVARRGHSILNFDDPMSRRIARHARGRIVWFSMQGGDAMPDALRDHVGKGGIAALWEAGPGGGTLAIHRDGVRTPLMQAAEIPATLHGMADFNIQNALAAAAMCAAHGVALDVIRRGLTHFASSFEDNPGRLNLYLGHPFKLMLDYAHNPASLTALGALIANMRAEHSRVIGMVSIPGDRRDQDIIEMGKLAAGIFDDIVFREAPDGRGRPAGEVNSLMSEGALEAGADLQRVQRVVDEAEAVDTALRMARPGDLLVLLPTSVEAVWRQALAFTPDTSANLPRRKLAHV